MGLALSILAPNSSCFCSFNSLKHSKTKLGTEGRQKGKCGECDSAYQQLQRDEAGTEDRQVLDDACCDALYTFLLLPVLHKMEVHASKNNATPR